MLARFRCLQGPCWQKLRALSLAGKGIASSSSARLVVANQKTKHDCCASRGRLQSARLSAPNNVVVIGIARAYLCNQSMLYEVYGYRLAAE